MQWHDQAAKNVDARTQYNEYSYERFTVSNEEKLHFIQKSMKYYIEFIKFHVLLFVNRPNAYFL